MRDSVPQPCEPLKRLERNFFLSWGSASAFRQFIGNFLDRGNFLPTLATSEAKPSDSASWGRRLAASSETFFCLGAVHQLFGSSLETSSTAATFFSRPPRARQSRAILRLGGRRLAASSETFNVLRKSVS